MFKFINPWTKIRERREARKAEELRVAEEAALAEKTRLDYYVEQTKKLDELRAKRRRNQELTAQNTFNSQRKPYVSDYNNSENEAMVMNASNPAPYDSGASSFIQAVISSSTDSGSSSHSSSCDSGSSSSSSSDSGSSSSSDSGSCGGGD